MMLQTTGGPGQPTIDRVETRLVDLPFIRLQRFARLDAYHQTSLFVRITDTDGRVGVGEAIVPCGPWWSGDSVESMKATIDTYLAPAMIGRSVADQEALFDELNLIARDNRFAKAALEMACMDLLARQLDVPIHVLLGGKRRDTCLMAWPLASGDKVKDYEEIDHMLETGKAGAFKVKAGAGTLAADLKRIEGLIEHCAGRAGVRVDPNESWSEMHSLSALPELAAMGVELVEQPVPREQMGAMARITARSPLPIMVDEGQLNETDMLNVLSQNAAHIVSLKIMKSGGIRATRRVADIAHAGGMPLYMGTFLETGLGVAAGMQLAASLPSLPFGGEIFTPLLLKDDLLTEPLRYEGGCLHLPDGPGIGVEIDEDKLNHYTRD